MKKIQLPLLKGKSWEVSAADILYVQAEGQMSLVCYRDENNRSQHKYVNLLLGSVEQQLCTSQFYRSHKSCVINLSQVVPYGRYPDALIEVNHAQYVPLSRRRRMDFHRVYADFQRRNVISPTSVNHQKKNIL